MKTRGRPKGYPWAVQPGSRKANSGLHIEEHDDRKPDSTSGKKVREGCMAGIRVTTHYEYGDTASLTWCTACIVSETNKKVEEIKQEARTTQAKEEEETAEAEKVKVKQKEEAKQETEEAGKAEIAIPTAQAKV